MDRLPKLLKPYYEISETFSRLNLVGANLDREDDILILARENAIELSLLLPKGVNLVKYSYASLFKVTQPFNFKPSDENIDFALEHLGYREESLNSEVTMLNYPTLMIPRYLYQGPIDDAVKDVEAFDTHQMTKEVENSRHKALLKQAEEAMGISPRMLLDSSFTLKAPSAVVPYSIPSSQVYRDDLQDFKINPALRNLVGVNAVGFNDEIYYTYQPIIEGSFFSEMLAYKVTFTDGREYWPTSILKPHSFQNAIKNQQVVITRTALQNYEAEYLGVSYKHRRTRGKVQNRREKILRSYIESKSLKYGKSLGRLGLWSKLSEIDRSLFPPRTTTDGTVEKFFKNQSIIAFGRGRKPKKGKF